MNPKSVNTNHPLSPLNLADVYRQLDYVIQEKSPYLTYYRNDGSNIFEPQLVESELRVSQVDKRDEVGRLRAMEEDIDRFGVTLSLLKLALGHLFDTVSKPNSHHPIPNQHNKESSKLSLSTLRSLTGKRQLYYEVSTVYDKVQGWRLDFIKQHYELSKSLQIEGEEDGSIRSDFFLPESLKRVTLTHPTKLSPEVNPIVDFETSLGSITSSSLTRIVKKLLPTRPTPINLKAPPPPTTTTTNNNRTEQSYRSSKPNKKNGELNTNYRPERPNNKPSNKNSKLESPSTPVVLSDSDDQINSKEGKNSFMSANTYLKLSSKRSPSELNTNGTERPQKKSATHDGPNQPFINPLRKKVTESTKPTTTSRDNSFKKPHPTKPSPASDLSDDEIENERLKNIDPQMVERIKNEIMVGTENLTMDSIAGLDHAKKMVREITILPLQRPDLFTGLRRPPKGVLLFGPPGTGKTLIGKCIASQGGATFFSISSSSLTSKWIGDGEKMVRALFAVARCYQPAVVFVDEIDSLLTQRTDNEVEASRRIKTEFLVQFDGCSSLAEDRILIIGATNRPQEIDEAARRRFMKRVYIPLPELVGRRKIVSNLLARNHHDLTSEDFDKIAHLTEGYSGSDMDGLCREAALGPIRSITDFDAILHSEIRPISFPDFLDALKQVRASVDPRELDFYSEWNAKFGTLS